VRLVPVPSSGSSQRRRGEDVVLALARAAARTLNRRGVAATVVPALSLGRVVADSAGLGADARAQNLAEAFVARRRVARHLAHAHVVLVDDIITTGVTLTECARALATVGVEVAAAATLAATQRRTEQPASNTGGIHG
jgi:predicted amidophosphoribosyltransferase